MSAAPLSDDDTVRLELARPEGLPPGARGLFRDDSPIRRISAENCVILGGGCALLLEVAHPLVAAAVARHSNFRSDPYARLQRTLEAISGVVFGDLRSALAAARGVEAAHVGIRGTLGIDVGRCPAGAGYDGRDPLLVRWVWATLVWSTLRVVERFARSLSGEEVEGFYADHRVVARVLGVADAEVPRDFAAFTRYFDALVARDLAVGGEAREIARFVLDPPRAAPGAGFARAVTRGLLPAPVRQAYGLQWTRADHERLAHTADSIRRLRREP